MRAIAMLAAAVAIGSTAQAEELPNDLTCLPDNVLACSVSSCDKMQPGSVVTLSPSSGTYHRCGSKACDKYEAAFSVGGLYLNAVPHGKTTFLKMDMVTRRYVEASSLMDTIFIFRGQCVPSKAGG